MKLDRELTEKLFNCSTAEDLTQVVNEADTLGKDLETASRISIDEVLNKFYHKRCTGTKKHAVEMLRGAIKGEDVPDVPSAPSLKISATPSFEEYAQTAKLSSEERITKIQERVDLLVKEDHSHFIRFTKLRKDSELKSLSVNEEDIKTAFLSHPNVVAGLDSSKKLYVMARDPEIMKLLSSKNGDTYFE